MANHLGVLLSAVKVASPFEKEVKESLATLSKPPTLVAILSTSAAPSRMYANFAKAQCENLGVKFVLKEVGAGKWHEGLGVGKGNFGGEGEGVEEAIVEANEDDECDGILVFYPIFGGRQVGPLMICESAFDVSIGSLSSTSKECIRYIGVKIDFLKSLCLHSRTWRAYITNGITICTTSKPSSYSYSTYY